MGICKERANAGKGVDIRVSSLTRHQEMKGELREQRDQKERGNRSSDDANLSKVSRRLRMLRRD